MPKVEATSALSSWLSSRVFDAIPHKMDKDWRITRCEGVSKFIIHGYF